METFEIIGTILVCIGIGFLLGYCLSRKIKENKETDHKKPVHSTFGISSENNSKTSSLEEIASEILEKSVKYKESFIKTVREASIPANIAASSIIAEVLKKINFLYFDELIDLIKFDYKYHINKDIKLQNRKNVFINEDDLHFAIHNVYIEYVLPLIKDENFEDGNSLKVFQKIEKNFSTNGSLIKYICEGDGKKYWNASEAEDLLILALERIVDEPQTNIGSAEKEFSRAFPKEFQIIQDLKKNSEAFLNNLANYDCKILEKIFRVIDLEEEYRCLEFLENFPEYFRLWLENTSIISDDLLFNYLAWNNVLPERFKSDYRYLQAQETLKEYDFSETDLDKINDLEKDKSLIEYIQNYSEEDEFVRNYINDQKFIPSLFWFVFEKEKWLNLKDAQKKLAEYDHFLPYLHLGYILRGYPLEEDVFNELCENEVIEALQLYYKIHHEKHLNRF